MHCRPSSLACSNWTAAQPPSKMAANKTSRKNDVTPALHHRSTHHVVKPVALGRPKQSLHAEPPNPSLEPACRTLSQRKEAKRTLALSPRA